MADMNNKETMLSGAVNPAAPTPIDWAYLAGFVDGEGSVCLSTVEYSRGAGVFTEWRMTLRVSNTEETVISWIRSLFGGNVYYYVRPNPRHRPVWTLKWANRKAVPILTGLLPYLKAKRHQVELALAFQADKKGARGKATITDDERDYRLSLIKKLRATRGMKGQRIKADVE
jgi:hypothetical protein